MPRLLLSIVLIALALPASAAAAERPYVYVVVIDGLDGDRVDSGGAPFIKSMIEGREGAAATYYRESRSVMIAETNPNHTAMATGAYGGSSGIPGNAFAVYGTPPAAGGCPTTGIDESKKPTTTSGEDASCLQAETLFQSLDRQDGAGVTTAGIFGKPKLGRLFAGKRPDGRYWADYLWAPCEEPGDDTPYCRTVPINPATRYAADDSVVMDEVIRTAREGVPVEGGPAQKADFTFVNLPQVDSAGHATGAGSVYDEAIALADAQIRRFVEAQRELGLWGSRTVLLLVSDHSMDTTPEKTSLAERFRAAGIPSESYTVVQNGSASLVYLSDRTDPGRFELLKRMREASLGTGNATAQVTGAGPVSEALYREPNPADGGAANTLDAVHPAWRLARPRAGDLVVTHAAGGAFSDPLNPLAGNHGGPQTRDNFMALIGPASMVQQTTPPGEAAPGFDDTERNPDQAENVDVAPTVARLLGFVAPSDSQGRILGEGLHRAGLPAVRLAPMGVRATPRRVRAGRLVRLSVRVRSGGTGIAGAKVRIGNRRALTDARGLARIRVRLGRPGVRRIVVTRRDYRSATARIRVLRR
jgi:predicted AlkP superfamily pyrophosphatase or phosphodiesterase